MRIQFHTREYQFEHGHAPRGFGSWAFDFDNASARFWAHSMTYADAKKAAHEEAKRRWPGIAYVGVFVLP
jgi:hypothetical protein